MNGPEILFEEMHRLDEAMERLNSRQQAFGRILSRSEVHCGDGGVESPPENSDQGGRREGRGMRKGHVGWALLLGRRFALLWRS